MEFFPETRIFLQLGPLSIYWYAIFSMSGALAVYLLSLKTLKKMGYTSDFVSDLGIGAFISAYIGARIWYCVFYDLSYYLANPLEFLAINDGGLAIQGGIAGGVLFGYFFAKKHKLDFVKWLDAILPTLFIGQAIGRFGNFVNQEAYGTVVEESFFDYFPGFIKDMMFIDGAYRMPTFLMEAVGNVIGFIIIMFIYKKLTKLKKGDLAYAYLMWYGVVRFFVEGFRTDSLMIGPIRMAQLTSIAFIVIGLCGTIGLFRKLIKTSKPVILWDLDGTIIESGPAIIESYHQVLINHGKEEVFTSEFKKEIIGPPLVEIFQKYLPDEDSAKLVDEYRSINKKLHKTHVHIIDNVKDTIIKLKEEGYDMAIVSTKNHDGIMYGLKQFSLDKYFDVVIGCDNVEKTKPNNEGLIEACKRLNRGIDSVFFIGDTKLDIMAAQAISAHTIAYANNDEKALELKTYKPNHIINNMNEVESIIKESYDECTI